MAGVFKTLTPISDGLHDPDAEVVYDRFAKTVENRTDLGCLFFHAAGARGESTTQIHHHCASLEVVRLEHC